MGPGGGNTPVRRPRKLRPLSDSRPASCLITQGCNILPIYAQALFVTRHLWSSRSKARFLPCSCRAHIPKRQRATPQGSHKSTTPPPKSAENFQRQARRPTSADVPLWATAINNGCHDRDTLAPGPGPGRCLQTRRVHRGAMLLSSPHLPRGSLHQLPSHGPADRRQGVNFGI